jgi:hypothetical protein
LNRLRAAVWAEIRLRRKLHALIQKHDLKSRETQQVRGFALSVWLKLHGKLMPAMRQTFTPFRQLC